MNIAVSNGWNAHNSMWCLNKSINEIQKLILSSVEDQNENF